MQFTWKDFIYILVILFAIWVTTRFNSCHSSIGDKHLTISPVEQKVDKKGTSYSEIKVNEVSQVDMKHITDSIRKVLGKGQVQTIIKEITGDVIYKDTNKVVYIDSSKGDITSIDSTKDIKVSFTGNYKKKTGEFDIHLTPDTVTIISNVKHHWFKPDELTTNTYHTNSLFTPVQGSSYTIKPKRMIGCIGPSIGVVYAGKWIPALGITATFNLIPIRSK